MARPRFTFLFDQTFHVISVRHMYAKKRIPKLIQLYSYKICTTTPYRSARNVSKTLCCSSTHTLLFQIAIWRQAPVIKAVFHPASYKLHSRRSVSGGLAKWKFVDCPCKLRNLEIAHVLRNLRILRMRNAISRLRKFSDCAEHI